MCENEMMSIPPSGGSRLAASPPVQYQPSATTVASEDCPEMDEVPPAGRTLAFTPPSQAYNPPCENPAAEDEYSAPPPGGSRLAASPPAQYRPSTTTLATEDCSEMYSAPPAGGSRLAASPPAQYQPSRTTLASDDCQEMYQIPTAGRSLAFSPPASSSYPSYPEPGAEDCYGAPPPGRTQLAFTPPGQAHHGHVCADPPRVSPHRSPSRPQDPRLPYTPRLQPLTVPESYGVDWFDPYGPEACLPRSVESYPPLVSPVTSRRPHSDRRTVPPRNLTDQLVDVNYCEEYEQRMPVGSPIHLSPGEPLPPGAETCDAPSECQIENLLGIQVPYQFYEEPCHTCGTFQEQMVQHDAIQEIPCEEMINISPVQSVTGPAPRGGYRPTCDLLCDEQIMYKEDPWGTDELWRDMDPANRNQFVMDYMPPGIWDPVLAPEGHPAAGDATLPYDVGKFPKPCNIDDHRRACADYYRQCDDDLMAAMCGPPSPPDLPDYPIWEPRPLAGIYGRYQRDPSHFDPYGLPKEKCKRRRHPYPRRRAPPSPPFMRQRPLRSLLPPTPPPWPGDSVLWTYPEVPQPVRSPIRTRSPQLSPPIHSRQIRSPPIRGAQNTFNAREYPKSPPIRGTSTTFCVPEYPKSPPIRAAQPAFTVPEYPKSPPIRAAQPAFTVPEYPKSPPIRARQTAFTVPEQPPSPPIRATQTAFTVPEYPVSPPIRATQTAFTVPEYPPECSEQGQARSTPVRSPRLQGRAASPQPSPADLMSWIRKVYPGGRDPFAMGTRSPAAQVVSPPRVQASPTSYPNVGQEDCYSAPPPGRSRVAFSPPAAPAGYGAYPDLGSEDCYGAPPPGKSKVAFSPPPVQTRASYPDPSPEDCYGAPPPGRSMLASSPPAQPRQSSYPVAEDCYGAPPPGRSMLASSPPTHIRQSSYPVPVAEDCYGAPPPGRSMLASSPPAQPRQSAYSVPAAEDCYGAPPPGRSMLASSPPTRSAYSSYPDPGQEACYGAPPPGRSMVAFSPPMQAARSSYPEPGPEDCFGAPPPGRSRVAFSPPGQAVPSSYPESVQEIECQEPESQHGTMSRPQEQVPTSRTSDLLSWIQQVYPGGHDPFMLRPPTPQAQVASSPPIQTGSSSYPELGEEDCYGAPPPGRSRVAFSPPAQAGYSSYPDPGPEDCYGAVPPPGRSRVAFSPPIQARPTSCPDPAPEACYNAPLSGRSRVTSSPPIHAGPTPCQDQETEDDRPRPSNIQDYSCDLNDDEIMFKAPPASKPKMAFSP